MATVNDFKELLESSPWIILVVFSFSSISLYIKHPQSFHNLLSRRFRYSKQIEFNDKIIEALNFVGNEGLKTFHKDQLEKELFERSRGIRFFSMKYRKKFIELYPRLSERFNYPAIYSLRSYLTIKDNRMTLVKRSQIIIESFFFVIMSSVFTVLILALLFLSLDIVAEKQDSSISSAFFWLLCLFMIFIFTMYKISIVKQSDRLRVILKEIQP